MLTQNIILIVKFDSTKQIVFSSPHGIVYHHAINSYDTLLCNKEILQITKDVPLTCREIVVEVKQFIQYARGIF